MRNMLTFMIVVICTMSVTSLHAAMISTEASQNNGIFRSEPDTVQNGQVSNLAVKGEGDSYIRKAYIGFDLTSFGLDAPSIHITDATLTLTYVSRSETHGDTYHLGDWTFHIYGLADESLDTWNASTLTWNNAPANGAINDVVPEATALLGSFTVADTTTTAPYAISGENLVSFLNDDTDGRVTFIVIRTTRHSQVARFRSLATGTPEEPAPMLSMYFIPEPGTLALLGLGGLLLTVRRRSATVC